MGDYNKTLRDEIKTREASGEQGLAFRKGNYCTTTETDVRSESPAKATTTKTTTGTSDSRPARSWWTRQPTRRGR